MFCLLDFVPEVTITTAAHRIKIGRDFCVRGVRATKICKCNEDSGRTFQSRTLFFSPPRKRKKKIKKKCNKNKQTKKALRYLSSLRWETLMTETRI